MKTQFLVLVFSLINTTLFAQSKSTNFKSLYASIGWHRINFTRSTIHFRSQQLNYDFKLIKAKGIDDKTPDIGKGIDEPQWSGRLGYLFGSPNGWGIEFCYDHAKYILQQGQRVRLQGKVNGVEFDKDTTITTDFIKYEHTDGANYFMLSLLKNQNLFHTYDKKHRANLLLKAGAGLVRPKTNSTMFGNHYDEKYHVSGYLMGLEGCLRYELLRNTYFEFSMKGVYANYNDVLLYGDGRASQQWFSLQYLLSLAYDFSFKKKEKIR